MICHAKVLLGLSKSTIKRAQLTLSKISLILPKFTLDSGPLSLSKLQLPGAWIIIRPATTNNDDQDEKLASEDSDSSLTPSDLSDYSVGSSAKSETTEDNVFSDCPEKSPDYSSASSSAESQLGSSIDVDTIQTYNAVEKTTKSNVDSFEEPTITPKANRNSTCQTTGKRHRKTRTNATVRITKKSLKMAMRKMDLPELATASDEEHSVEPPRYGNPYLVLTEIHDGDFSAPVPKIEQELTDASSTAEFSSAFQGSKSQPVSEPIPAAENSYSDSTGSMDSTPNSTLDSIPDSALDSISLAVPHAVTVKTKIALEDDAEFLKFIKKQRRRNDSSNRPQTLRTIYSSAPQKDSPEAFRKASASMSIPPKQETKNAWQVPGRRRRKGGSLGQAVFSKIPERNPNPMSVDTNSHISPPSVVVLYKHKRL